MFDRILVAGRGEVAARIARTCRRIGAHTVAVHGDDEEDAVHVQACDASVRVGPPAVSESYRSVAAVIDAARRTGCVALHPGYGFFDDDPAPARVCERSGITYIGNAPETTVLLRDRIAVRNAARDAGLRVLPGSRRPIREADELRADAEQIGYPLVIKPAFGISEVPAMGRVSNPEELEGFIARTEWDGTALDVEREIERPRHVEVQVVGDGTGDGIAVGDREVSVRKDERRLIAESPAPAVDALPNAPAIRSAIWAASVDFMGALGFRGVGAVHFLFDARGHFYFDSFHPVLQPEHVVNEACSNVDLVEVQVRLANGEAVPSSVRVAEPTGHAVQARIEAAIDPRTGQPFSGRVDELRWPPAPAGRVRIESGIQPGSRVQPDHDPLLASVTTYAPNRHEAILMLDRIIAETRIGPLVTNLRLLRRALNHESFRAAQVDEGFLHRITASH
jgi:acetyl/propionyl-CoA carboxylase alpha subunit